MTTEQADHYKPLANSGQNAELQEVAGGSLPMPVPTTGGEESREPGMHLLARLQSQILQQDSWQWARINTRQLFRFSNVLITVLPHRHQRILRPYRVPVDVLLPVAHGLNNPAAVGELRAEYMEMTYQRWYSNNEQ